MAQKRKGKNAAPFSSSAPSDVSAVFIADPKMCERVLRRDGRQPKLLVPNAWTVYNKK